MKGVFVADDYVTVTKKEGAEWRDLTSKVFTAIANWKQSGQVCLRRLLRLLPGCWLGTLCQAGRGSVGCLGPVPSLNPILKVNDLDTRRSREWGAHLEGLLFGQKIQRQKLTQNPRHTPFFWLFRDSLHVSWSLPFPHC